MNGTGYFYSAGRHQTSKQFGNKSGGDGKSAKGEYIGVSVSVLNIRELNSANMETAADREAVRVSMKKQVSHLREALLDPPHQVRELKPKRHAGKCSSASCTNPTFP